MTYIEHIHEWNRTHNNCKVWINRTNIEPESVSEIFKKIEKRLLDPKTFCQEFNAYIKISRKDQKEIDF